MHTATGCAVTGLADAPPVWLNAGNRVLLTSRPYGLDEDALRRLGVPQAPLEPLPNSFPDGLAELK
jgi:hypothetical protein